MKKFLSLFAAVLFAGSMMAAEFSWDWSTNSYSSESASTVVWTNANATLTLAKNTSQSDANNYLGGGSNNHTRVYKNQKLTLSPAEGVTITSVEITSTTDSYATKFKNAAWTNATASSSASKVTVTPTDGTKDIVCVINEATRATEIKVSYYAGEAPAVSTPAIAGDEKFYNETEVSITCSTEDAKIYYTIDGSEPSATSTAYSAAFKLTASATVKAIAIKGEDKSEIAEKAFTKNPSFDTFEDLIAAELPAHTLVEVSFEDLEITRFYASTSTPDKRQGIFFNINEVEYEIYNKAEIPAGWAVGGIVSGTIRGDWYDWNGTWEVVPSASDWKWTNLTYKDAPTALDDTNAEVKAEKFFRNGQLIIRKNGVEYNALGTQL